MNSVGIIGLGSIGRRHARLLNALVPGVRIAAYRTRRGALNDGVVDVRDVDRDAFLASRFDAVVISNPSSMHCDTLAEILERKVSPIVLVEKPFCTPEQVPLVRRMVADHRDVAILAGNSLRFHPAIASLKSALGRPALGAALECHAHFGTFMPGWHPYEDYRTTYAAKRALGGGVLLTSIHEIDLVHHLFGPGDLAGAFVSQLLLTETDVEDTAHLLLRLQRCRIANVSLNFFERPLDRSLKVVFESGVWSWRFRDPEITLTEWIDGAAHTSTTAVDAAVDAMYIRMWQCVLAGDYAPFELESVFGSLNTVAAARRAVEGTSWN